MGAPRRKRPIRQIAVIRFLDLPPEIQTDFAVCLRVRLERIYNLPEGKGIFTDDVRNFLTNLNPELPLLMVETWLLVQTERETYEDTVLEYMAVWESGEAQFPPVVIDSESDEVLCEGGHRSLSASLANIKEIEAVDVASIDPASIMKELPTAYQVRLTSEADRQYRELNKGIRERVDELLDRLREWPQVSGVVALWGTAKGHFRIKTGDWRVVFHVDEGVKTVWVDSISHRKDAYDQFHTQTRKG